MAERVVVVGCGAISDWWFSALVEGEFQIVGVVDIKPESAEAKIQKYNLEIVPSTDLLTTLEKQRPDFVVDLTVPEAHCEVTCAALEAGFPVVGEKPMSSSMEEARKMVATSERTGKLYMVSQSRRWDVNHDSVRLSLKTGMIGALNTMNCDFYAAPHFGGFRDEMPSPLILDMAIHHFDLARFMGGVDPVAVYAKEFNPKGSWYRGDAAASCVFEMTNGVIFTYRGSWCADGFETSWNGNWRMIGDQGTLLYEQDTEPRLQVIAGEPNFFSPLKDAQAVKSELKATEVRGALHEMQLYLQQGQLSQTECHDNIKSLAMVFAVKESSATGKRVVIKAL